MHVLARTRAKVETTIHAFDHSSGKMKTTKFTSLKLKKKKGGGGGELGGGGRKKKKKKCIIFGFQQPKEQTVYIYTQRAHDVK